MITDQPDDMPVFVLKAKDQLTLSTVGMYYTLCENAGLDEQAAQVALAYEEIRNWQRRNPDRLQLPDHPHVPVEGSTPIASPPPLAVHGCDDCSSEPGEPHGRACPALTRAAPAGEVVSVPPPAPARADEPVPVPPPVDALLDPMDELTRRLMIYGSACEDLGESGYQKHEPADIKGVADAVLDYARQSIADAYARGVAEGRRQATEERTEGQPRFTAATAYLMPRPRGYQCAAGCGHDDMSHREHGCDVHPCECPAPYGRILPSAEAADHG